MDWSADDPEDKDEAEDISEVAEGASYIETASFDTLKPSELVILNVLGAGAHATVYKAEWRRTFATSTSSIIKVAVKHLKTDLGEVHRNREQLTMLTDNHPNIVKCFDSTLVEPYLIVTELCEGGSLFDLLYNCKQALTLLQQVKILLDVASAMKYLHSQTPCILHRDLKSSNVLLATSVRQSMEPCAKVADFGLARPARKFGGEEPSSTDFTVGVGTYRWMAPEVFDETARYGDKVDVFSFAILMYEVLERRLPYDGIFKREDPRICLYVLNGNRPEVHNLDNGTYSPEIRKVLLGLMERSWHSAPMERPSFEELENELSIIYHNLVEGERTT